MKKLFKNTAVKFSIVIMLFGGAVGAWFYYHKDAGKTAEVGAGVNGDTLIKHKADSIKPAPGTSIK